MGPLMPFETELQFFLIFLLMYRLDSVRDMGKGGWSEKSEGEGKNQGKKTPEAPHCGFQTQLSNSTDTPSPQEHCVSLAKSDCDHDFAFQGDVFSLWKYLSQLRG